MNWKAIFPNLFTSVNLLLGVAAIIFALNGHISLAPWCIALAALADFLDGFLARLLNVSGSFGQQLDTLADMVTFGVVPGILALSLFMAAPYTSMLYGYGLDSVVSFGFHQWMQFWLPQGNNSGDMFKEMTTIEAVLPIIAFLIPVFSALRLAKFNIDTRQTDRFYGLPTPANALLFSSFILMGSYAYVSSIDWQMKVFEVILRPWNLSILSGLFAVLLIVDWPLIALKFKSFSWAENWERYIMLIMTVILLLLFNVWGVPIIVFLYLMLSLISEILRKNKDEV